LLKEKDVDDVGTDAVPENHPIGAVDLEVVKITSENLKTSYGLDDAKTILKESTDGADEVGEVEV
jgi:hypothetical protein